MWGLGLTAFTAMAQVQALVGKLKVLQATRRMAGKKKENHILQLGVLQADTESFILPEWEMPVSGYFWDTGHWIFLVY